MKHTYQVVVTTKSTNNAKCTSGVYYGTDTERALAVFNERITSNEVYDAKLSVDGQIIRCFQNDGFVEASE